MSAWIARHRKLLAAVAGAAVTVVVQVWGTNAPWATALILIATAAGVYRAPNNPPQPAPAAAALPRAPGGRGAATGTVRVMPAAEPGGYNPAAARAERRRDIPSAGTAGTAPSGTA